MCSVTCVIILSRVYCVFVCILFGFYFEWPCCSGCLSRLLIQFNGYLINYVHLAFTRHNVINGETEINEIWLNYSYTTTEL